MTFSPVLKVPFAAGPIKIDGDLSDASWRAALTLPELRLPSGKKPEVPTRIKMVRDNSFLYLGFRCTEPDSSRIVCRRMHRDHPVWRDDCIEILLDENNDHRTYKHLIINAKGNVADLSCDGVHTDLGWNCPMLRTGAQIRDGEWCLEAAIPLSLFPSPLAGINLMRTRTHYLSHAMLVNPLHDPRFYPRIHLEDLGGLQYAVPPKVSIGKNRYAVKGMLEGRVAVHLNSERQSEFDFSPGDTLFFPVDFTRPGKNHLAMSVSVKGKKDFVLTFTENPAAPLQVSHLPAYLFQNEKMLSVRGSADINSPEDSAMTLEAHIGRGGSQVFQTAVPVTGKDFLLTLPLADLMPDTAYQIHFILRSPRHLLGEAKRCFFLMHDPL